MKINIAHRKRDIEERQCLLSDFPVVEMPEALNSSISIVRILGSSKLIYLDATVHFTALLRLSIHYISDCDVLLPFSSFNDI